MPFLHGFGKSTLRGHCSSLVLPDCRSEFAFFSRFSASPELPLAPLELRPQLRSLLNRTFRGMTPEQHAAIVSVEIEVSTYIDYTFFGK